MTTVVPDFLMGLLEDELRSLQEKLLKKVAKEYGLDEQLLIERMLSPRPIKVVPDRIEVVRKAPRRDVANPEDRCKARIWNRGRGGQCTRAAKADELCTHHHKELEKEGKLRHGWIHEKPSKEIFGKPTALYITTQ